MKLKARETSFWGKKYIINPELIEKKYGNGSQLMRLTFYDMRPNYYLVWIDSKYDLGENTGNFHNFVEEEIICDIESFYGYYETESDIDDFEFPQLIDTGSGYRFGKVDKKGPDYKECFELMKGINEKFKT